MFAPKGPKKLLTQYDGNKNLNYMVSNPTEDNSHNIPPQKAIHIMRPPVLTFVVQLMITLLLREVTTKLFSILHGKFLLRKFVRKD